MMRWESPNWRPDSRQWSGRPSAVRTLAALGLAGLFLTGCAETRLVIHAAKSVAQDDRQSGRRAGIQGNYKVGDPYQINGLWYYPAEDWTYDETGIASWYGPDFHGKSTANGEKYDMNEITAAHKTLPMPSFVRVTNLENGRSIVVKVNDRGPFAPGRIIDMSRRSAQLLGFERQGTARVRVQILGEESRALAMQLKGDAGPTETKVAAAPRTGVMSEALPPPPGSKGSAGPTPVTAANAPGTKPGGRAEVSLPDLASQPIQTVATKPTSMFVQVGAFSRYDNANKAKARLSGLGDAKISSAMVNQKELFRVRIGPMGSVSDADVMLESVIRTGYPDAKIVID